MHQPEDNFDLEKSIENWKNSQSNQYLIDDKNLSVDNIRAHKKQLKRIFFRLMAYGLVAGVILSIGAVILLKKFGLTDKPTETQPKQEKQLPTTEIKFSPYSY